MSDTPADGSTPPESPTEADKALTANVRRQTADTLEKEDIPKKNVHIEMGNFSNLEDEKTKLEVKGGSFFCEIKSSDYNGCFTVSIRGESCLIKHVDLPKYGKYWKVIDYTRSVEIELVNRNKIKDPLTRGEVVQDLEDLLHVIFLSNFKEDYQKTDPVELVISTKKIEKIKPIADGGTTISKGQESQNGIPDFIEEIDPSKFPGIERIIGNQQAVGELLKTIKIAMADPELRKKWGVSFQHILLYGPPGTGKTMLAKAAAKALAEVMGIDFISVSSEDLSSKWVGEGEQNVNKLFDYARSKKPVIVFIDELDSLLREDAGDMHEVSRKMINAFLKCMDGMKDNDGVIIIGATNDKDGISKRALRAGRFTKQIYVGLPSEPEKSQMFHKELEELSVKSELSEEFIGDVIERYMDGWAGADINALFVYAREQFALYEMEGKNIEVITEDMFAKILEVFVTMRERSKSSKRIGFQGREES